MANLSKPTSTLKSSGNYKMEIQIGILGIIAGLVMMAHPLMTGFLISYTIAFVFIYQGIVAIVQFFKMK